MSFEIIVEDVIDVDQIIIEDESGSTEIEILETNFQVIIDDGLVIQQKITLNDPIVNDIPIYNGSNWIATSLNNYETKYEKFILDILDLNNKYITIQGTINDNQSIRLFADNIGIKLEQGVDYSVSGNQIFWSGYALENLLEVGDTLQIFYI